MKDQLGREINYMRISVTDQCNLRCRFCMPTDDLCFMKKEEILEFKEILAIAKAAVKLGIVNFRITGGEPLVREGIEQFLYDLKHLPGVSQVFITTNGVLLEEKLEGLKRAGIDGINVSLCSTDPKEYKSITGRDTLSNVLAGIKKSVENGIHTKINCVPVPNLNDTHLLSIASIAKNYPIDVRFIEMMPIGQGASFAMISERQMREKLSKEFGEARTISHVNGNGPAKYVTFDGFLGNIGFISARSCAFCSHCNRVRLSADGYLKLCLNYEDGISLKETLRGDNSEEELIEIMSGAIYKKPVQHNFNQEQTRKYQNNRKYMAQIGG